MCGSTKAERWAIHRHGRYVQTAMVWPSTSGTARVTVADTEMVSQALRLCSKRNAARLAGLINLHEPMEHMKWKVVTL